MRNKRPAGTDRLPGDRIPRYVHGSTYPSSTAFDLPLGGMSAWTTSRASASTSLGFDVYCVDLPGYGLSGRPAAMDAPPADNPPLMRTQDAAKVAGQMVDFITKRRGVEKTDLMGWSWGTSTMGLYTSTHNDRVNRLVLYSPQWLARTPGLIGGGGKVGGLSQRQPGQRPGALADRRARGQEGRPDPGRLVRPVGGRDLRHRSGRREAIAAGPAGAERHGRRQGRLLGGGPAALRPGEIRVPVLIIHAERDADLPSYQAQEYFTKLTHAPYKRFVELGEGTHTVMMEKNRMQFLHEVGAFLTEADPQALN
ncbi:alpha/beta hydrolase [Methylobacterium oryzae CBMB20]